MSGPAEYGKPLWQFIQRSPFVFWSTVVLAALVVILFVALPPRRFDYRAPSREAGEELHSTREEVSGAGPAAGAQPFDSGRFRTKPPVRGDAIAPVAPAKQPSKLASQDSRPKPAGAYTVQVGSFSREETARRLASKLEAAGYPAFVKSAELPGKGRTYRVRVGAFATREEAKRFGDRLLASEKSVKAVYATVND